MKNNYKTNVQSNNSLFCFLFTVWMIMLVSGCINTYDYVNYQDLYLGIVPGESLETGYVVIQNLFRSLGASYNTFRFFIIAVPVFVRAILEYKIIGKKLWLLELFYIFYALPFEAVNIRNNISVTFVFVGIFWALKSTRFRVLKYVACCLIGSLFQISCLAYCIFALAIFKLDKHPSDKSSASVKKKNNFFIAVFGILFFCFFAISKDHLQELADFIIELLYSIGLSPSKNIYFKVSGNLGFLGYSGCHMMFVFTIAYVRSLMFSGMDKENNCQAENTFSHSLVNLIHSCNLLLIFYLPIIRVSAEFYRIFRGIACLEYLAFFVAMKSVSNKRKDEKVIAYFLLIITVVVNFAFQIVPHFNDIFKTMFTDNIFW